MQLRVVQRLPGSVDAVIAALVDPRFIARLGDLPNLAKPELLQQERAGDRVEQRIRHRFTGSLSGAVTRVVDPAKLTWVEESSYDLSRQRAAFRIVPDHYAGKLRCDGTITFTPVGDETERVTGGELSVRVPLVGRVVERAIVSGLEDHLRAEAALLHEWLEVNG